MQFKSNCTEVWEWKMCVVQLLSLLRVNWIAVWVPIDRFCYVICMFFGCYLPNGRHTVCGGSNTVSINNIRSASKLCTVNWCNIKHCSNFLMCNIHFTSIHSFIFLRCLFSFERLLSLLHRHRMCVWWAIDRLKSRLLCVNPKNSLHSMWRLWAFCFHALCHRLSVSHCSFLLVNEWPSHEAWEIAKLYTLFSTSSFFLQIF